MSDSQGSMAWLHSVPEASAQTPVHGDLDAADAWSHLLRRLDDPVRTLAAGYQALELTFSASTERAVDQWGGEHRPGARGTHDYDLSDYGLTPDGVRERFTDYLRAYDATA